MGCTGDTEILDGGDGDGISLCGLVYARRPGKGACAFRNSGWKVLGMPLPACGEAEKTPGMPRGKGELRLT